MRIKASKYAAAGVREYWTIDPESKRITVYTYKNLPDDVVEDTISIYGFHDQIPVGIYDGKLKNDFNRISGKLGRDFY